MSTSESVEIHSPRGNVIAATLHRSSESSGRGMLLVNSDLLPNELTERLTGEGLDVLALGELPASDREALADMEAACKWLEKEAACEELFAIGAGDDGTRAFLLACTASVLEGVISVEGPLQIAELSRERPFQPLEMALSLSCPLLAFFGDENERVPQEDQERAIEVLSQFARTFDIVARPGVGDTPLEKAEVDRIVSFLSEVGA